MDSLHRSLARLNGRPYRTVADETTLEMVLRRGPLPPIGRPLRYHVKFGLGLALLAWFAAAAAMLPLFAVAMFLFSIPLGMRFHEGVFGRRLHALRARQAHYPLPLTGHVGHWLAGGEVRFGGLELVLREPHPLAEATVRLTEPDADMRWSSPTTLRIQPRWSGGRVDFSRLDRLVLLLNIHRDELGLERIELSSPETPRR